MSVLRRTPRNCVFSFRTVASVVNHNPTSKAPQFNVWRRWRVSFSSRSTSTAWERCVLRIRIVPSRVLACRTGAFRTDAHRSRARARGALSSNIIAARQCMRLPVVDSRCGCLRACTEVIDVDECRRFFLLISTRGASPAVKQLALWLASVLQMLANSELGHFGGRFAIDSPLYDRRVNEQRARAVRIGLTDV